MSGTGKYFYLSNYSTQHTTLNSLWPAECISLYSRVSQIADCAALRVILGTTQITAAESQSRCNHSIRRHCSTQTAAAAAAAAASDCSGTNVSLLPGCATRARPQIDATFTSVHPNVFSPRGTCLSHGRRLNGLQQLPPPVGLRRPGLITGSHRIEWLNEKLWRCWKAMLSRSNLLRIAVGAAH